MRSNGRQPDRRTLVSSPARTLPALDTNGFTPLSISLIDTGSIPASATRSAIANASVRRPVHL
jgi:hypothetical protein